jgi:predicted PhzF superfamily epimerase YddE/YHI9
MPQQFAVALVHAFSSATCAGNPAAVVLFDTFAPTTLLQQLAAATGQPVTVMLCPAHNGYHIRWFSSSTEINLCGHGTLAAAAVLFNQQKNSNQGNELAFYSPFGNITVAKQQQHFCLTLHAFALQAQALESLAAGIIQGAIRAASSRDLILEFATAAEVTAYQPDFAAMSLLPWHAVIVTAASAQGGYVFRYFAPKIGINEDPATGSAHCSLMPYWASRLGHGPIQARQLSATGGEFVLQLLPQSSGDSDDSGDVADMVQIAAMARLAGVSQLLLPEAAASAAPLLC